MAKITFPLTPEDGWPPVGAEHLHCEPVPGGVVIDSIPLFVSDLSAGDVIETLETDEEGRVWKWKHVHSAPRSTVWVMNLAGVPLEPAFQRLRGLGCRIEGLQAFNLSAVDVPIDVAAGILDGCFSEFTEDQVALAFPSWRHDESDA